MKHQNPIEKTLATLGMGDGEGNTSNMRVLVMMVACFIFIPHVYVSMRTNVISPLSVTEWATITAMIFGKGYQSGKENPPVQTTVINPPSV